MRAGEGEALAGSGGVAHGSTVGPCLTVTSSALARYESRSSSIGHIDLGTSKQGCQ
jgi:hypothetical protein